ncbi:hypothetical protein HK405_003891 [Cladochytrium tenue]|nr:hypothetical protein HK405_003891 [Cladochytrium tenue]
MPVAGEWRVATSDSRGAAESSRKLEEEIVPELHEGAPPTCPQCGSDFLEQFDPEDPASEGDDYEDGDDDFQPAALPGGGQNSAAIIQGIMTQLMRDMTLERSAAAAAGGQQVSTPAGGAASSRFVVSVNGDTVLDTAGTSSANDREASDAQAASSSSAPAVAGGGASPENTAGQEEDAQRQEEIRRAALFAQLNEFG